jgi:murein DD-endopeptidase MepM/ murein hydrolase activator NlpD
MPILCVRSIWTISASLLAAALATAAPATQPTIPPKAAQVTGAIEQVSLGPVFADRYLCVEHALELEYPGDALGTDCVLSGGVEIGVNGFLKLYRTDGKANADWYGWHANVLAPFDGTVIDVSHEGPENVPGVLGSSPAGAIRFKNAEGIIVTYAHVAEIAVKPGDRVATGQIVAKLGNNGQTRAPGIHIGAYREADTMPLQIRWDLRAMAKARAQAGIK